MLSIEFFEQNLHFALSLFAALVFFAVFWLYFDAWLAERTRPQRDLMKWLGFLLISLSFAVYSTVVEQANLGNNGFNDVLNIISSGLRLAGYIAVIIGQILDPLQKRPDEPTEEELFGDTKPAAPVTTGAGLSFIGAQNSFGAIFLLPIGAATIAWFYFRRATTGIERHLRPVAYAYGFLFLFELLSLTSLLRSTNNPALFSLVRAFGPIWVVGLLSLLVAMLILGHWVWHYLTERFLSQLFMTFTAMVLAVFLITTVSFTFLLLRSVQNDALNNLQTATSVLDYALDSRKAETKADAESIASNPVIVQAIIAKDHKTLSSQTTGILKNKQLTSLIVTTADAQVLLRAENPNRWGDSISSDTLVRRALIGIQSSTVTSQTGVLAPTLSIEAVIPARDKSGHIIGTVTAAIAIDNAFVDGLKQATGLDTAIYSGNVRSATTLTAPDGTSRWVGVKESNTSVTDSVLKNGAVYRGSLSILNRQYLAVYAPLKNSDNAVVGMLFVGQPQISILQTSNYLIGLTFIVSVILLALAVIPAYLLARQIAHQLE